VMAAGYADLYEQLISGGRPDRPTVPAQAW
jgi:hypothetical protein